MRRSSSFWHSIKWRIFSYYTLLITVTVSLLVAAYVLGNRQVEIASQRTKLIAVGMRFLPIVFPPGGESGSPPRERDFTASRRWDESMESLRQHGFFLKVTNRESETILATPNVPEGVTLPEDRSRVRQFKAEQLEGGQYIIIQNPQGFIFVGQVDGVIPAGVLNALWHSVPLGLLTILIFSVIGYHIIRSGLRPIGEMSTTTQTILEGDLSRRFEVGMQESELERLAELLNQAFSRLQAAYDRQVQFTADTSHELRTPVAAILADCQFSLNKPRDKERYLETIEVCHESAQHMRLLLDQLGVLAAFDHPEMPIELEEVELGDICRIALNVVQPLAQQAGIALRERLEPALAVKADPLRLSQAIINLLKNAIHYNHPEGSVELRILARDSEAVIEVEDTGIGIPGEQLESIFERFTRLDKARSTENHNFGLGLAITQSIVKALRGRITVTSVVGEGSTFRIHLPLATT